MATKWVSTLGTNTNSGTTYALAKKTIAAGVGLLTTGDVLNIVNDGVHNLCTPTEIVSAQPANIDGDLRCRGTSWGSYGCIIQGTDSSGNPALATVAADASHLSGLVAFRDRAAYVTIRGLKIDWSAIRADATVRQLIPMTGDSCWPLRIIDCEMIGHTVNTTLLGNERRLFTNTGASYTTETEGIEVSYCVFVNASGFGRMFDDVYQPFNFHHNVVIIRTNNATQNNYGSILGEGTSLPMESLMVTHNTVYMDISAANAKAQPFVNINTTNMTDLTQHSNAFYLQGGSVNNQTPIVDQAFRNANASFSGNGTRGTMGYNVWAIGTSAANLASWTGSGFYDEIFHPTPSTPTATVIYGTDNRTMEAAPTAIFNTTSTTWTWDTPGGYSHVLPYDLRLVAYRTGGLAGSVPGAIQEAVNIPPVAVADTYAVTAGNTLTIPAPGVQVNDTNLPVGDTMTSSLVTNVAIGTLSLSSDGGFTYTPPINFSGTVTFTYKDIDSYLAESNVTTVTITVDPYPLPDEDVDEDISYGELVDTLPFFRPVLKAHVQAMVRVHRNTNRQHIDMRHYLSDRIHWESSHRVCEVAPAARKVLTLGGVHRAVGFMLETDVTVNVTVTYYNGVTDTTFKVTVADCLLIEQANVRHAVINNTSSATATVQMSVFD